MHVVSIFTTETNFTTTPVTALIGKIINGITDVTDISSQCPVSKNSQFR